MGFKIVVGKSIWYNLIIVVIVGNVVVVGIVLDGAILEEKERTRSTYAVQENLPINNGQKVFFGEGAVDGGVQDFLEPKILKLDSSVQN